MSFSFKSQKTLIWSNIFLSDIYQYSVFLFIFWSIMRESHSKVRISESSTETARSILLKLNSWFEIIKKLWIFGSVPSSPYTDEHRTTAHNLPTKVWLEVLPKVSRENWKCSRISFQRIFQMLNWNAIWCGKNRSNRSKIG